jgi:hypothetical protein
VVGDAEDLALVGGELVVGLVGGGEDSVRGGAEADAVGALLDGLHGVLHLEHSGPCLTASMAKGGGPEGGEKGDSGGNWIAWEKGAAAANGSLWWEAVRVRVG